MKKRLIAIMTVMTMLASMLSAGMVVSADTAPTPIAATQNENQDDGIILKKSATANPADGTVDIMIDAYTTGKVTSKATATPADIVLVLDVSGSMDNKYADAYTYTETDGERYISDWEWDWGANEAKITYGYGFSANNRESYYINDNGTYRAVSRSGEDANGFAYYRYTDSVNATVYVYPVLGSSVNTEGAERANTYDVKQFYTRSSTNVSRIAALKASVDNFIDKTLAMNNTVTDEAQKHRIAVVKYADDSYYSSSGAIADIDGALSSAIGNNRFRSGNSYYNYTQLVHDFAVVDEAGDTSLKASVDALETGGATAVDYGLKMAQATLNKRTSDEKAARKEVVIVFSDGEPTHGSEYSPSVAGTAINIALALKNAGTVVYSLSVFTGANSTVLDGTSNTNKFMHYISNNYPKASYTPVNDESGTITPGTGNPTAGYYMTPETEQNLTSMFEHIIQEIGAPNITLGTDTTVVDTLSPYFDLKTDTVGDVEIEVINKTFERTGTDGEGNPIYSETPTYTYDSTSTYSDMALIAVSLKDNRQILVDHFDFDGNYVSAEPRTDGFAGRILRITIKTKPNYDAIDKMSPRSGIIDTNLASDPAKIVNPSQTEPIATTTSPQVGLKKVSYLVDGESFANGYYDVYRLPGSEYNIIPFKPTKEGHTFGDWGSTSPNTTIVPDADNGHFTMPANDVVISGSFTRNNYNVTYEYVGTVPAGAEDAPDEESDPLSVGSFAYEAPVPVADAPAVVPGYTFSGWSADNVTPTDGSFNMPADHVKFAGSFKANGNTPFTIEHYLQNLDGSYPTTATESYTDYGTTDTTATATPNQYEGFEFDQTTTANPANQQAGVTVETNVVKGSILGNGKRVLKLYYMRRLYRVEYEYDEAAPTGAPTLPATDSYLFGANVIVADGATMDNYTFHGWTSETVDKTNGETFAMPAHDVVFNGHFVTSGNTPYFVEHWLQDIDGTYRLDIEKNRRQHEGHLGSSVNAIPVYFEGYKHDSNVEGTVLSGTISDNPQLVLKLYYNRELHNVVYEYIGIVPDGANELLPAALTDVMYKAIVNVADDPYLAGYKFEGWQSFGGTVQPDDPSFEMPNRDVQLRGQFIPLKVEYTVKHIAQDENGGTDYTTVLKTETFEAYTGAKVTAVRKDFTGYTFNASKTGTQNTGTVLGDGSLVLYLYYDRNPLYSVEYAFAGNYPNTVTAPTEPDHIKGEEVTLKDPVGTFDGYTFSGWTSYGGAVQPDHTSFTMPARDVHLTGYFTPDSTGYRVEYYFRNIADTEHIIDDSKTKVVTKEEKKVFVGDEIVAAAEAFEGFKFNTALSSWEKVAEADPAENVLKLYYDRLSYNVSYAYWGTKPDGAPTITYPQKTYKYGATVTIEPDLVWNAQNKFQGWYSAQTGTEPEDTHFKMPAIDVVLVGSFISTISTALYKVEHYTETSYGSNTYALNSFENIEGAVVGEPVTATPKTISGYTYNPSHSDNSPQGIVLAEDRLVLRLYYTKNYSGGGGGGGGVRNYILTFESNGGTKFSPEKHQSGKVVELDEVPQKEGYIFDGWHLDEALNEDVSEVKMTKNITVYANWIKDNGAAGNGHDTPSSLNGDDHFAYVIGYPDGTVRPNANITRAEVTSIFFRLLKEEVRNANLADKNGFADVPSDMWYNTAISTMTKLGVVKGRFENMFVPDANITRAEFATICARFDESEFAVVDSFSDVLGHWAEDEIHEAAAHGWIRGYENNTFKPDQYITRAEAMTMINRVLNRVPEGKDNLLGDMIKWPDNKEADWHYLAVQEATNSHEFEKLNNIYEKWTKLVDGTDWKVYE